MKRFVLLTLSAVVMSLVFSPPCRAGRAEDNFPSWLERLRQEAFNSGVSEETLDLAFAKVKEPLAKVVDRDRQQPEFTETLARYLSARLSERRIKDGRKMMRRYPTWLERIEKRFGVQKRFVVALWGIESSYGKHMGTYPVVQSLVTLAYDRRRSSYFRQEIMVALRLLDEGVIPFARMQGSWAGAMGQCQFMPSSFLHYAVDADSSGSINIWGSIPDVLGSTANYLAKSGWRDDQTWGRKVELPKDFDESLVGLQTRRSLSHWQRLGLRRSDGRELPRVDLDASLILPDGQGGPAYLVYDNFRVLLAWNRSNRFAIAVGTLADQFKGY